MVIIMKIDQKKLATWIMYIILSIILNTIFVSISIANNVIVVIIDGSRYSETFGAEDTYMPFIWNQMRPQATIFTNFYNDGTTKTNPGHATIVTGNWQNIANNGSERPNFPTIFEYYRQQTGAADSCAYVIAGADKLSAISYSTYSGYGSSFGCLSVTNNYTGDLITYNNLITVMDEKHPKLIIVNFKEVDKKGHAGNRNGYLTAITQIDSLLYQLWLKIENDPFYKDNTTMFITNDHGRHDDEHGGFKSHGDNCEGCRHIMCLAIGKNVGSNQVVSKKGTQIDFAPTMAELLSVSSTYAQGASFTDLISQHMKYTSIIVEGFDGYNSLIWEIKTDTLFNGFIVKRANEKNGEYNIIANYKLDQNLKYLNGYLNDFLYTFFDDSVTFGTNYWYKVVALDTGGVQVESEPVFAAPTSNEDIFLITIDISNRKNYFLKQNYPNPFNPNTTIEFSIPNTEFVSLEIYNMLGQKVATLLENELHAGTHKINWNANKVVGGTYFYRLRAGNYQKIKKLILLQ